MGRSKRTTMSTATSRDERRRHVEWGKKGEHGMGTMGWRKAAVKWGDSEKVSAVVAKRSGEASDTRRGVSVQTAGGSLMVEKTTGEEESGPERRDLERDL